MRAWLLLVLLVLTVSGAGGRRGQRKRDGGGPRGTGPIWTQNLRPVLENQQDAGSLDPDKNLPEHRPGADRVRVPSSPGETLTQEEIQRILWREEEEHQREEARLRRKDEARRERRKQRREQEEKQRKEAEERRREEEEALRLQVETEEEEWRRQVEEEERRSREEESRRREEEDRRKKEREARDMERRRREEERRRQEETLRDQLLTLAEEEEQEEEEWLRGDVFQMPPPPPPAGPEDEQTEEEGEVGGGRGGLPPGCHISDVTVSCDGAGLLLLPALSIPELKSLSLEGNQISSIPAGAFSGVPNLEWLNLKRNRLSGVPSRAFRAVRLRRLYLDGNLLDAVPFDLPASLQELKVNENRLSSIHDSSFQGLSALVTLELEGNQLSEVGVAPRAFAPLTQLSYLRLGRNRFRTVPQGLPASLQELYLEENRIEEVSETAFNRTAHLNRVSLRHNQLDETSIAPAAWIHHRNLESLDLSHNRFHLVPSFLPRSLVHLVLVGNRVERIPGFVFAHMKPGLEYLYLSYNQLGGDGVEPESFFGAYRSMVEVCLDHNQLLSVPAGLNEMTNLQLLRLDSNRIRSIPDDGICDPAHSGDITLVSLRLENNFLEADAVSPSAFSCVRAASSVVLRPQRGRSQALGPGSGPTQHHLV